MAEHRTQRSLAYAKCFTVRTPKGNELYPEDVFRGLVFTSSLGVHIHYWMGAYGLFSSNSATACIHRIIRVNSAGITLHEKIKESDPATPPFNNKKNRLLKFGDGWMQFYHIYGVHREVGTSETLWYRQVT